MECGVFTALTRITVSVQAEILSVNRNYHMSVNTLIEKYFVFSPVGTNHAQPSVGITKRPGRDYLSRRLWMAVLTTRRSKHHPLINLAFHCHART